MKSLIFKLVLSFPFLVFSQSIVEYGSNTTLDIGTNADLCADSIVVNGTLNGNGTFCGNPTDIETEENNNLPLDYSLSQNYPNPFNPNTMIKYSIKEKGFVKINLYDILGNVIKTLVNEEKTAGRYEFSLNASNLSSGVYFYRIFAGDFVDTKKMILIK